MTTDDIKTVREWGCFPRKHRRLFLAQRGRCPYCGDEMDVSGRKRRSYPSREHVKPRHAGHTFQLGNSLLAHAKCNWRKGGRPPFPCEILFAEVTAVIVLASLPLQERRTREYFCHKTNALRRAA